MILGYTLLNDKVFGKMVHPTYTYGQDGYIFFNIPRNQEYGEYHEAFADMVKKIQDYCEERSVPFLFVFNPSKISVLSEYLPKGVRYNNDWVDSFLEALDKRNVNYISNMSLLQEKTVEGEVVFNQKFDAGHWNDLGAFYGVNHILEVLQKDVPHVRVNQLNAFEISEKLETTLPVSEFPIHEMVPDIHLTSKILDLTSKYDSEVARHSSYRSFGYFVNPERQAQGAPKTLVFQGSYMNSRGFKFLQNSLGEYIYVHDYQNVIDFPYYFNIFKPECVIFEVAEYTFSDEYFSLERMKNISYNSTVSEAKKGVREIQNRVLASDENIEIETGKSLTKIKWEGSEEESQNVWLLLNEYEFDMQKCSNSEAEYEVTVENAIYALYKDTMKIITKNNDTMLIYQ